MNEVTPIRPQIAVRPELVEGPARNTDVASELRYWAFLSYSHHDKLIAKRLQRQLETYRVPRRLIGRETSAGPVPARVTPVFRDRDELHAGADLKASVQDALSRSRWLIVVCTPDAARSPWVNREIIEFKRLRGERHVLALIARGEPFASDMPGREAEECFPPALRRALTPEGVAEGEPLEPIAADMRKQGDGPQRAMLKLLAGMVGVGFDDLVRRDMQRRVRLLSAVAALSVLGVMGFAVLAVMAVKARNEAQHQRVQAEGLIEFMLGDLRKKLEPVGRLEVLDSVGEKALAYYSAQDADRLDATALGHRSRAMHLIGEIRDLRGNPAEAQAAFEQAASTTAQLLAQAPNDGQRIFDHAQSVFWVGNAAWKRADGKTAEAKWQEYLELAQRLTKIDPSNVDWRAEVAFAHVNLGTVQLDTGRPAVALRSLQLAGELLAELVPKRPDLSFELAQNHGWLANAYELLGDYALALVEQQRKLALLRSLPGIDKNRTAQRGMLNTLNEISQFELALGKITEAEANARESWQFADALVNADAKNLFWRGGACVALLRLVEIQLAQGHRADAQTEFTRASSCVTQFNAAGSLGLSYSIRLNARVLSLSALLVPAEKFAGVAAAIDQFLDQSISKLTSDTPDRAKLAVELANAALAQGALQAAGNPAASRVAWHRAEAQLQPFADMHDGAILTSLARARLYLGDVQGAQTLAAQVQRSSYRHPAYADLVKKLQAVRGGGRPLETAGVRP
ncbi:MAG: toll/interleukin-1 receptor domain-containing protein [Rhizobacter sp.]